jgi:hypothetical protein
MKLFLQKQGKSDGLRWADLQVVKAAAPLALLCPFRSMVSGVSVDNIGE